MLETANKLQINELWDHSHCSDIIKTLETMKCQFFIYDNRKVLCKEYQVKVEKAYKSKN